MSRPDTGDPDLDQVLEWEAELRARAFDMLDEQGLDPVVEFLAQSMNASSAWEALWRLCDLFEVEQPPEPSTPEDAELNKPSLRHSRAVVDLVTTHSAEQDPEEIVGLLVESIDGECTCGILEGMAQQD